jgi:hypothetical protein
LRARRWQLRRQWLSIPSITIARTTLTLQALWMAKPLLMIMVQTRHTHILML